MKKILFLLLALACLTLASNCELCSFVISDSAVAEYAKLPKLSDTSEVFKILDKKKNLFFMDREAMDKDLENALVDYPELHKIVNNNSYASEAISKKLMANVPPEDSIVDYVWMNSSDMDSLKRYIRAESWQSPYSKTVARFLDSLKNIVFADSVMMRDYALSLFAASMGVCYDTSNVNSKIKSAIWDNAEVVDLFRRVYRDNINDKFVKRCIEVKDDVNPFTSFKEPKTQLEKDCLLNQILTWRYRYLNCSEDRWYQALKMIDTLYTHLLEGVIDSLTQKNVNFSEENPVVWHDKGCGCSQYKDLNGNVYAIYPYWLAKKGGDTLDFSVVTRIAYYGIYADNAGKLILPSGSYALNFFNKPRYSNFVNIAHKHNVKVDWVVAKSDWSGLSNDSLKMTAFFEGLISDVVQLVNKKNNSMMKRFVSEFTIDGRDMGFRGDGVTLWFKNYPTDAKNTEIFRNEFKKLQNRLWGNNEFAFVNMMMDLSDLTEKMNVRRDSSYVPAERGIYSYKFFYELLEYSNEKLDKKKDFSAKERLDEQRNFLIVFNNEPVSRNKLVVYNDLNQQLSGTARTEVLHAVVPMLWLDYKQFEQLENDASFYNDAFYSLGISPYGLVEDSMRVEEKLSEVILKNFEKEDGAHKSQGAVSAFFCTNRWLFRMLNTIVYVFVFILLFCYFVICQVNAFFTRHLALFVAFVAIPPLLTTFILSNFDPAFMDFVGNVGRWGCFAIIVLTVIVITLLQVYRSKDFPKRK